MNENDKKYWFKRRRYGYGWIPVTWQGWLAIIVFTAVILGEAFHLPKKPSVHQMVQFWIVLVIDLAVFLTVALRTSPPAHWRWGKKDTDNTDEDF